MANVTVSVTAPSARIDSWAESQGWDGETGTAKEYLEGKFTSGVKSAHIQIVGEKAAKAARLNAIKDL